MAGETELESLVVRLLGDGSEYIKMLNQARDSTKQAGAEIEAETKKIGEGFSKMGLALAGVGAAITAAFGSVAREALGNFQEAELIGIKLTATLEANGRAVAATKAEYEDFARAIEKVTTFEDDHVLSMLRTAETYKLTGQAAQNAVRNAISLASATDTDAESSIRLTAALERGDIEGAQRAARMIRQLRGIKDEATFVSEAEKLIAVGLKTSRAEMDASSNQIKILRRDFGNMLEDIGAVVARGLKPLIASLTEMVAWFRELPEAVKVAVAAFLALGTATGILLTATGGLILVYNTLIATVLSYITVAGLATVATIAFQASLVLATGAIIGGILYAINSVVQGFVNSTQAVKDFNAELSRAAQITGELQSRMQIERGLMLETGRRKEGPEEKKSFFEDQLKAAQKELLGTKANVEATAKEVDDLSTIWNKLWEPKIIEEVQNRLKESNLLMEERKKTVSELQKELAKIKDPSQSAEVLAGVSELTKKLEEERVAFGLTARQAQVLAMELKGATPEQLKEAVAIAEVIDKLEEDKKKMEELEEQHKKTTDSLGEFTKGLLDEIETFGMSADAAKLHKLSLEGLTVEEYGFLESLIDVKEGLEAHKKLLEDGSAITKEFATPLEKFQQRSKELSTLLEGNAISQDTFNRAMGDAKKKFDEAAMGAKGAREEIQKFDSALSGSSEAAARVQSFRDMLKFGGGDGATAARQVFSATSVKKIEAVANAGIEVAQNGDEDTEYLKNIRDLLEGMAKRNTVEVEPAGLA